MNDLIKLKFNTDKEDIKDKIFLFDKEIDIESLLNAFLSKTNSLLQLDPNQIQFIYKSKIINSDAFKKKKAKEIFKFTNQNHLVQVYDANNIIGGIFNYLNLIKPLIKKMSSF